MAITLGGGGSASQINEVILLNNDANTVTLADGRVYLKGGVYETNPSTYPLASLSFQQAGINFSVAAQDNVPLGIAWDGTHYWVGGNQTARVYKYTSAGVYTGTNFSIGNEMSTPYNIVWDGSYLWVFGGGGLGGNTVFKYNSAGVYQNVSWSSVAQTGTYSYGMTWDGTHFWITHPTTFLAYKYNSSGVYQNASIDFSGQITSGASLTWDGTYFWVADQSGGKVFKYSSSGVYQGYSFSLGSSVSNIYAMAWDGTGLSVVDAINDKVWQSIEAIGVTSDTSLGGQNYVRVA